MTEGNVSTITEEVRAAIADSGLSLGEIGRRADVPTSVLSRFMREERSITVETLDKIAEALGLRVVVNGNG